MSFFVAVITEVFSQINVTVAGVQGSKALECSRQVNIVPDLSLEEAISKGTYDVVVLPGGLKGSQTFCQVASNLK